MDLAARTRAVLLLAAVACGGIASCGGNVVVDTVARSHGAGGGATSGGVSTLDADCMTYYSTIESQCQSQASDGPKALADCKEVSQYPSACASPYEAAIHCYAVNVAAFVAVCDIHGLTGAPSAPCTATDAVFAACIADGG
jgi:hypothetical protein